MNGCYFVINFLYLTCSCNFYCPQTKFAKVMFLHLVCHSVQGGGWGLRGRVCAWQGACAWWGGACMAGGMCGRVGGMCSRGHAWWGAYMVGVCMTGGHVWQGGVHAMHAPTRHYDIGRSMRGRYASYWNAFLFLKLIICLTV